VTHEDIEKRRAYAREYYRKNKEKKIKEVAAQKKKWKENIKMRAINGENTIKQFISKFYSQIKSGAKVRGIKFELTKEQVELLLYRSNGKCAISGTPIVFAATMDNVASIDRKDSNGHYTLDNVQVVSKMVNKMKMEFSTDRFLDMCRAITEHNGV